MTGMEKLDRIQELLNKGDLFRTYKDCEEIADLRKGLKVSDFFIWLASKGDESCMEKKLFRMMGTDAGNCTASWNTMLEEAINGGYVKRQTVRDHGKYSTWISLTRKGRKTIGI